MRSRSVRYAVAVLATGLGVVLHLALGPTLTPSAFATAWAAVLFSAWYGGLGPGLLATLLSAGVCYFVFLASVQPFSVGVAWVAAFAVNAALISWCVAALSERAAALTAANRALHEAVGTRDQALEELRRERDFSRRLINSSRDGIVAFDRECRYQLWNPAMERMTGVPQTETLGKCAFDLFPFLKQSGEEQSFREILAGRSVTLNDRPYVIPTSGRDGFYEGHAAPLHDEDSHIVGGLMIVRDITESKRRDEALHQTSQMRQALFDASPLAVVVVDTDGNVKLWSPAAERLFGWKHQEVVDRLLPNVPEGAEAEFRALLEVAVDGHRQAGLELRRRRKDGSLIDVSLWTVSLRNAVGQVNGVAGFYADITERKRTERELKNVSVQLRTLLESITDAFLALDNEGHVTYLNPRAEQLLHVTRDELVGKSVWEVFPQAMDSIFYGQYQHIMAERVPIVIESYSPLSSRWLTVRAYPFPDGISALIEDSTQRHTAEVTALSEILQALNAEVDVAKAFPIVATGLQRLTGCNLSDVFLFDEGSDWMTVVALGPGDPMMSPDLRLRIADMPAATDVLSGRPHIAADLASEREFPLAQFAYEQGFRSALSVPLRGTDGIAGILSLLWYRYAGASTVQVPLVGQIADAIALAVERKRLFEQVETGHERLKLLSQRLIQVEEVERRHLARELHDEVGQMLTALKFGLSGVDQLPAPVAHGRLQDAQQLIDDLLARVRALSLDLRPAMLDDFGLLAALLWLVDRYSHQTKIHVQIEHRGLDQRLAPEIETAAYRIVQEALTNVARHAAVPEATVRLWIEDQTLMLQIVDHGKGFDAALAAPALAKGGVLGMRERARLLGGDLTVESSPSDGTRVSARLPV